ncbi:propane 2-monooxygenase effector subunit MimD [Saccharopolyspora gloriosae]|uniref:propane 2-monooxygenase effector subunit MimD n=1 Tax=Saccharopolyspora gloriosae TaxID=455344 RepID=UPI001FB6F6AD|nr:MmoB/DmpM family protein [Saccharopolyspora gloriosae]
MSVTASNMCGVTLMNNQNGHIVAEIMARKEGVRVDHLPSMIRVDAHGTLIFEFEEIADEIGFEFDQSDFEEIMSTHYGRMVHLDDRTVLFANPEDAAEYIDFDLKPVSS